MSQTARHELIASLGPRYSEAGWDDKRWILDEFTAATGYQRKYAMAVLNHPTAKGQQHSKHESRIDALAKKQACTDCDKDG